MMQCPMCGKMFDAIESEINEAGNPICPECREKELREAEEKATDTNSK